ncbi:MAG: hypothetical protein COB51_12005 [Moraxellaceae bacterium]|nr:MAG: hypothetical protein COB51_12005 [Moraxellaceae bacterium]
MCNIQVNSLIKIALLCCLLFCRLSYAIQDVSLEKFDQPSALGSHLEYLLTPNSNLSVNDIRSLSDQSWTKSNVDILNIGFIDQSVWVRFRVKQNPLNPQNLLIELAHPNTDWIDVYFYQKGILTDKHHTGDGYPFQVRPAEHLGYLFPVNFGALHSVDVYIKVTSKGPKQIPLFLWSTEAFHQHDASLSLGHGLYYGMMLVMIFYNLFIYITIRERVYLFYILYVFSILGFQASLHGTNYQFLWPNFPAWNNMSVPLFIGASMGAIGLFTHEFLNLKKNAPVFSRIFYVLITLCLAQICCSLFLDYSIVIRTGVLLVILISPTAFIVGILLAKQGYRNARFFSVSWLPLLVGTCLAALNKAGIIPINFFTDNALPLGSAIEVVLLSIALASRITTLKEEQINSKRSELAHKTRQMEAEKLALKANAENQAKSEFLAKISHEIRTPMNGILGMSQLLHDSSLSQQQAHYNDIILSSGHALLSIINDILDYSRIEQGQLEIQHQPFNLHQLLESTLGIFALEAYNKSVELMSYTAADIGQQMNGDPGRIRQILVNLISNAFKFTQQGQIIVYVEYVDKDQSLIRFTVTDSGSGIDQASRPHLFEPFTQADENIARKNGGTGLGLAISKQLAELMSGEIGFCSEKGFGSRFWFTARLTTDQPSAPLTPKSTSTSKQPLAMPSISQQQRPAQIFLAYENAHLGELIQTHGIHNKMHLNVSFGEQELIDALSTASLNAHPPSLICIDIDLKNLSLIQLCAQIRQLPGCRKVPIILLCYASQHPNLIYRSKSLVTDLYQKPFHLPRLLDFIGRELNIKNQPHTTKSSPSTTAEAINLTETD